MSSRKSNFYPHENKGKTKNEENNDWSDGGGIGRFHRMHADGGAD